MTRRALAAVVAYSAIVLTLAGCGGNGRTAPDQTAPDRAAPDRAAHGGQPSEGGTLRLALSQPEDHPSYVALQHLAERFAKATGGRWRIEIFANEGLGAQQEALQLTRNGTVDMMVVAGAQLESVDKDFAVFNLPHVFDSIDHQMQVVNDKDIVGDLYASLERKGHLAILGGFTQGARSVYANKPVTSPADLDGMKIRTQESEVQGDMVTSMGGAPTPMAYGEIYTALQSGVLDGAENNEVSYVTQKHYEVAKDFSRTEHLIGLDYLAINSDRLRDMRPRDRAALQRESTAATKEFTKLWKGETAAAIKTAKSHGARFHTVDDDAFGGVLASFAEKTLRSPIEKRVYAAARAAAK